MPPAAAQNGMTTAPSRPSERGGSAALILNPHAGHKLGLATNQSALEQVSVALEQRGIRFHAQPSQAVGDATALAHRAVSEGCELVIAAGGDGTAREVAEGLVGTGVPMAILPLGSIMNVARSLGIPRTLDDAADVIAAGNVRAMDVGRVHHRIFLEAAGVGLDAGLYAAFNRLDRAGHPLEVLSATWRFLRRSGTPRFIIESENATVKARAPMVTVANGPYCGAAYMLAPNARVDDGLLDVIVFRGSGILRMLLHLGLLAGGRRLPLPPEAQTLRVRSVTIRTRHRRGLPVHADGMNVGRTAAVFECLPAALQVVVGEGAEAFGAV